MLEPGPADVYLFEFPWDVMQLGVVWTDIDGQGGREQADDITSQFATPRFAFRTKGSTYNICGEQENSQSRHQQTWEIHDTETNTITGLHNSPLDRTDNSNFSNS